MPGAVHILYGTSGRFRANASGAAREDQLLPWTQMGSRARRKRVIFSAPARCLPTSTATIARISLSATTGDRPGRKPETGFVVVLYGSTAGITTDAAQLLSEDSLFGTGSGQNGEGFGGALTSGDLNDDGYPDLVVGAPSESVGGVHAAAWR